MNAYELHWKDIQKNNIGLFVSYFFFQFQRQRIFFPELFLQIRLKVTHTVTVKIIHPPLLHHFIFFAIQQILILERSGFRHRIIHDIDFICKYLQRLIYFHLSFILKVIKQRYLSVFQNYSPKLKKTVSSVYSWYKWKIFVFWLLVKVLNTIFKLK